MPRSGIDMQEKAFLEAVPRDAGSTASRDHTDTTSEITAIVLGCQQNDRESRWQLYERFGQKVYGHMVRMAGPDDAADLTQQVFLQVFQSIRQFAAQARFDTWLYRVATNEALQHLRRRKRRPTTSLPDEPLDERPNRSDNFELRELLDRALARLDDQLRSLFLLREVEALSYHQISEVLGIPEGTVGSRLNRARNELRQHLTASGWAA